MDLKNKKLYPKSKENINFKAYLLNLNKRKKYW